MSEEKPNNGISKEVIDETEHAGQSRADDKPEIAEDRFLDITINKSANELIIKDPETGKTVRLLAKITQIEEEEEEIKPLTPDEFRDALERIDALGITWTADRFPQVKPKESVSDEIFLSEEFEKIRRDYPTLPVELSSIIFHILTGSHASAEIVGSQDDLKKKVTVANNILITPEYRSEFFFKHATKVPYLREIDWEVVFKLAENNVKTPPCISYALLSLRFLDPNRSGNMRQQERTFTVAVDEELTEGLIDALSRVKKALEAARPMTEAMMRAQSIGKEKNDADDAGDTARENLE